MIGVEQLAVRAAKHVRRERLAQRVRLQQYRQAGERALFGRRAGKAAERRPDGRFLVRANGDAFVQQSAFDPFGGPGAITLLVDACERLECDRTVGAEVVILTAQAERRCAHRAAHVERENARAGIAAELHGQRGEQDRFPHAGRAGDQRVAHVADVRHQPERRRAFGAGDDQRRAVEMLVLLRSGPHRRHRHQVREVQRRDDGLAHVGVGVARHRRQPRLHRIEGFGDGHEAPALNHALHLAQLLVGRVGIAIEHSHGRGDEAEGDLIAAQLLHGGIGVGRLVAGVGIDQRRFLLEDRFA